MIIEQRLNKQKIIYPYVITNDFMLNDFINTSITLRQSNVRYLALLIYKEIINAPSNI
jgi:hypothetical protein